MNVLRSRELILAAIVAAMWLGMGLQAPAFLSVDSIQTTLTETAILSMMALAQMAVILTRGIDLSVASNVALTGMIVALVSQMHPDLQIALVMLLAIFTGLLLGLVNGGLIAFLGIPPIVVTLGTLAIFRGMIYVLAGGKWLTSKDMTDAFLGVPKLTLLGLSSLVYIAIAVAIAFYIFLNFTRTGRGLYAVGGNPVAARYCGIDLWKQQLIVYGIAGAVSGISGYLWVSRYGIAYSDLAPGFELTVIAACVIGGVSIAGGIGTVPGTLLGALFLGLIANALPVMQVSPFWQMAISGAVILAAVIVNTRTEKRPAKLILPEARRAASGGHRG